MKYLIFFLVQILCLNFCTSQSAEDKILESINDVDQNYIIKYVLEDSYLEAVANGTKYMINTKNPKSKALLNLDSEFADLENELWRANNLLVEEAGYYKTVELKSSNVPVQLFNYLTVEQSNKQSIKDSADLLKESNFNEGDIYFIISDIHRYKNDYVIAVSPTTQLKGFDAYMSSKLFYFFSKCGNGIILFKKKALSLGWNEVHGHIYKETRMVEFDCN